MRERTSVLYEATNLTAPAQLAGAVAQIREYFSEYPGAQPPLPHNLHELTPCSVRITETEADTGLKTGTVIITKPDGVVLYEPNGQLSKPQRSKGTGLNKLVVKCGGRHGIGND